MYTQSPELMLTLANERVADLQRRADRKGPRVALFTRRLPAEPKKPFRSLTLMRRKAF